MSMTIDQKVVEMRFDNRQFESGVSTTLSTLDKLKQSLNLNGAAKGLENVGSAARSIDMSGLSGAVETVGLKFSAMYTIADQALRNIVNSAMTAGKRIASALTIDPIKTGFAEYETQINAVQTILANTSSKGTTLDNVNSALDTLNTYADKTIYNFTEMTRNIGTFTAAGIDLQTSVDSIQGIANLAAVSGSTSQQASTAMYQLSQALASGTVKLMDWNSVVNAGMGGEMFQNALKETSKLLGTGAEAAIKAKGSFRDSLQTGWLTSEVLTETLKKFTTAGANERIAEYTGLSKEAVEATLAEAEAQYGEADAIEHAAKALAMKSGKSEEEIKNTLQFAKNAEDAATKVKTVSQLWDTLKESAQSGWTQTWEIIVGDFEEAKELLTNVSNVLGEMIGNSAKARNELLQGWKDAGGRAALIEALGNAFEGIMNVIKPIKEAFREIFPPLTVKNLTDFTTGFKNLTASFADFTASHGDQIKSLFKGIFSVFDIGWTIVKELAGGIAELLGHFTGFSGGILGVSAAFGDWLTNLRNSIHETDVFGKAVDKITGFFDKVIEKAREFANEVKKVFAAPASSGFIDGLKKIWDFLSNMGAAIVDAFAPVGESLSNAFGNSYVDNIVNTGLFAGVLVGVKKFVDTLTGLFDGGGNILENLKGILDDVRGCFEAYQQNLQANTLSKIAVAIGVLAAAIFLISTIDSVSLAQSLTTITVLFTELMASLSLFTKLGGGGGLSGVTKSVGLMIGMSVAILILASALKKMEGIDTASIARGLVAIGVLMAELSIFLNTAKFDAKFGKVAGGMVLLSVAMLILAKAVEQFGGMQWGEIGKGLAAIGGLLAEIAIFTNLTGNAKHVMSTGVSMLLLGAAMKIFASVVSDFSSMSWEEIGRGLAAMGGALLAIGIAMNLMPTNMIGIGVGMVAVAASMTILAGAMSSFAEMSWEEIGRGLIAMGGALLELSIALNLMNGTLGGSAALLIACAALSVLTPVLQTLGGMSWGEIVKGLATLAGAFAIIGVAGYVLMPVVPTILALSAALMLIGLSTVGIGVGLGLVAAGIAALATVTAASAAGIVASLTIIITGLIQLIPTIAEQIGLGIVRICQVIAASVPQIAVAGMELILGLLQGISTYLPQILQVAVDIIVKFIDGIAAGLPRIIEAGVNLIIQFVNGMANSIRNNTQAMIAATNNLMDAVLSAIGAYFGNIASKGIEIVSKLVSGLKSKLSDLKQAGKDMMAGFIEGVKAKFTAIKDAAVNAISGAVDGVKSFLGIASPSKLFAEIGMFADEGLAKGLTKYAHVAAEASVGLGKKVVSGMKTSMLNNDIASAFRNSVFDDDDWNPTVKPVLDLTNVQNGAGRIGNLLGSQSISLTTSGMRSSVGSIAADMNAKEPSYTKIVDALAELRSDFGSLANAVGNMSIRMDSGVLVGSIVGKVDSGLGMIASHKGRGN